jgi:hypothetical protein
MYIEGTRSTPSVLIEPGKIEINGRSIPEDSAEFFEPVLSTVSEYFRNKVSETVIHFHLEYINSGSKKYLTNILSVCAEARRNGHQVRVLWYFDYDDESMEDLGNDLKKILDLPFSIYESN